MSQNHPIQHLLFAMDILPLDGEHLRNNNNQNTLWHLRDRLFQVLFERATVAYASTFSYTFRKFLEFSFLFFVASLQKDKKLPIAFNQGLTSSEKFQCIFTDHDPQTPKPPSVKKAVISLFTLAYIHVAFVQVPVNCLEKETHTWSREGVLRVEISTEVDESLGIPKYCNKVPSCILKPPIRGPETPSIVVVEQPTAITIKIHKEDAPDSETEEVVLDSEKSPQFINRTLPYRDSVHDPDCPYQTILSDMEMFTNTVWPQDEYIIEYSLEYGFLRLSPAARQNTSVKVHTVTLDPDKDTCFGNKFSQFLLKYIVGYGDVLMSSLRYLVDKDENKGFVRNVVTGDQYRFVDKSTTWTAYFSAAFIMMVFTLSISMLLRYSHHQIFMFIVELLHVFEFNTSVSFPAAPLLTVVLALVGMEAIMSEFFNDSTTAFYIILIVWVADQYDTICCHTPVSKRHWLRFFYLYHFAFYAYHYRFNGQYSSLALATSWLFIQHSMLYFFHRYELPAVLQVHEPNMEHGHDDSAQLENEAVMPDSDILSNDTESNSPSEDNADSEFQETSLNANEPQESENSDPDASTVNSENSVKSSSKQTVQPSPEDNRVNLVS